jgi:hypothetical protein
VFQNGFLIFLLVLPLYGFPITNLGSIPLRLDWLVVVGVAGSFVLLSATQEDDRGFDIRMNRITVSLLLFNLVLALSLVAPLLGRGSVVDHLTTWVQYLLGSGLFIAAIHTRFDRVGVRLLLRLYVLVAFVIATLGLC